MDPLGVGGATYMRGIPRHIREKTVTEGEQEEVENFGKVTQVTLRSK